MSFGLQNLHFDNAVEHVEVMSKEDNKRPTCHKPGVGGGTLVDGTLPISVPSTKHSCSKLGMNKLGSQKDSH